MTQIETRGTSKYPYHECYLVSGAYLNFQPAPANPRRAISNFQATSNHERTSDPQLANEGLADLEEYSTALLSSSSQITDSPKTKSAPTMIPPGRAPPVPHAGFIYKFTAKALGASMWFFLMYRAKKDGPVLLGWKKPWEH